MLDEGAPIFSQIAEGLAHDIAGRHPGRGRPGAVHQRARRFNRINPATAAKGINVLADSGLVEKRRGVGMFVSAGARARLLKERRKLFASGTSNRWLPKPTGSGSTRTRWSQ